jgi:hypothetical protein
MRRGIDRMTVAWRHVAIGLLLAASAACAAQDPPGHGSLGYTLPGQAGTQFEAAKRDARATGRRILIVAGGDWCRWCHVLDRFLHRHDDLQQRLDAGFVVLKLAVDGEPVENPVLDALPRAIGYPHFWVLSADGTLIESVETSPLEQGRDDYDRTAFSAFLDRYAPGPH